MTAILSLTLLTTAAGLFSGARENQPAAVAPAPPVAGLRAGDLVFRRGKGILSDIAARFSGLDRRYSHVGILVTDGATLAVAHAIRDDEKAFDGVVIESMAAFLQGIDQWAIYRLDGGIAPIRAESVRAHYHGVVFDRWFDLDTKNRLYCTEFISDLIRTLTGESVFRSSTRSGKAFISVDALYMNDRVTLVSAAPLSTVISNPARR